MSEPGYRAEQLIIPGLKHFVLETLEPAIGMLTGYERQNPRGEEPLMSDEQADEAVRRAGSRAKGTETWAGDLPMWEEMHGRAPSESSGRVPAADLQEGDVDEIDYDADDDDDEDDDDDDEEEGEEAEEEEGEEAEEEEGEEAEEEEEDEEDEEGMEEEKEEEKAAPEEEKAAPVPRGSGGGDGEALRKLMAAAKLRPRDATTYTSLARAVGRAVATKGAAASPSLKDFAIRSWKLAVQLAPARPSALRELAAALRAQGKEQAAERILARVAA